MAKAKAKDDPAALWHSVERTDPAFTKKFNKGRFGGTTTCTQYHIKRATELWGPAGDRWGFDELEVRREEHGETILWLTRVEIWYPRTEAAEGKRREFASVAAWGGCRLVHKGYVDEDAPKKAFTDGLSKAFSYLGFSADIFMGLYDDNKYVQGLREEFSEAEAAKAKREHPPASDDQKNEIHRLWMDLRSECNAKNMQPNSWSVECQRAGIEHPPKTAEGLKRWHYGRIQPHLESMLRQIRGQNA